MKKTIAADGYYEQCQLWGRPDASPEERRRITQTLSLIPEGTRSVLDVGCGDGRIASSLLGRYNLVCGIDASREALKHVKVARTQASIGRLPFRDGSFDLVMCCEVLEHLPIEIYPHALKEIERIASRYAIITVPAKEDLRQQSVSCPACHCVFHRYRHVRSFTPHDMSGLLNGFELRDLDFSGEVPLYPTLLVNLARLVNPADSAFPATAICPQCGYQERQGARVSPPPGKASCGVRNTLFRLSRYVAGKLIVRKRPIWILGLYVRLSPEQSTAHATKS